MGVMLTDLATACRRSGLRVVEVPGWKTRTRPGGMACRPLSIVCHHTATSDRAVGNYPSLSVVRDGRAGLPGPLAQIGLGRDGTVYVIAAGRCNHAGRTRLSRQSNSCAIGIECEASGAGPIEGAQLDAYVRLVRALCDHYGIPTSHVESHGEVAVPHGRKNDVRNDMDAFRRAVSAVGSGANASTASSAPTEPRGPFPLPAGHWYGPDDKTARSHSGARKADRGAIRLIQRKVGAEVDGDYGPATKRAVAAWQKAHNLTVDGLVGPNTWKAM